jgi:hypothetical protein
MDRQMLVDHLDQAERRVAQGAEHVARQRMLVNQLDCQARTQARELLAQFEEMQRMHIADRDRLRAKLTAMNQTADMGAPAAEIMKFAALLATH